MVWNEKLQKSAVASAIAKRHSVKKLADRAGPETSSTTELLYGLCAIAGQAPFHRRCQGHYREYGDGSLDSIVPWRMHALDQENCRKLHQEWQEAGIDGAKLSQMLLSALGLVIVTWLPDLPESTDRASSNLFVPSLENMEHIAAAGAVCQNLLVLATDLGLDSYWSSGGILRNPDLYERLGINPHEILIGGLFVFAGEEQQPSNDTVRLVYSNLRNQKGEAQNWARAIKL
jgi:nitroreductase